MSTRAKTCKSFKFLSRKMVKNTRKKTRFSKKWRQQNDCSKSFLSLQQKLNEMCNWNFFWVSHPNESVLNSVINLHHFVSAKSLTSNKSLQKTKTKRNARMKLWWFEQNHCCFILCYTKVLWNTLILQNLEKKSFFLP